MIKNSSYSCTNLHRKPSIKPSFQLSQKGERCNAEETRRRNTLFKNPVVKILKNLSVLKRRIKKKRIQIRRHL